MSTGRFQVIEGQPPFQPCKCAVCGSGGGDGRLFIDFSFHIEYYGQVYFCSYCFEEATSHLGWTSPVNTERMSNTLDEQSKLIDELKEENANLDRLLNNSLTDVRNQLDRIQAKQESAKRSPGRPKKSEG